MFSKFKSKILYVKVEENTFIIKSIHNGKTVTVKADTPFSNKRLLIAEFTVALKVLTSGIKQLTNTQLFAPTIIMHPLENIDETLSEVEEKVLKEIALNAGAREVKLWLGKELSDKELLNI